MPGLIGKALAGAATAVQPVAMEGLRASIMAERDARLQQYKSADTEGSQKFESGQKDLDRKTQIDVAKIGAQSRGHKEASPHAKFLLESFTKEIGVIAADPEKTPGQKRAEIAGLRMQVSELLRGGNIQPDQNNDPFGLGIVKPPVAPGQKSKAIAQPSAVEPPAPPKSNVDKSLELAFGYIGQRPRGSSFFIDAPSRSPLAGLRDRPFASREEAEKVIRELYSSGAK